MNKFQREILKNFQTIREDDFLYFTEDSQKKVEELGLPKKECKISEYFKEYKNASYHRCEYCLKNCGFECLENGFKRK